MEISAKEVGAKFRSKREIYRFLTAECKCYLGDFETMTIWHLRDLAAGDRQIILSSAVKFISIPNYTGLKIEKMVDFARNYPAAMQALPIEVEIKQLHRQYLANVIYTKVGEPFQEWVDQHIEYRNKKVAVEKNQMVKMDPAVAKAFKDSTTITSKYLHDLPTLP